MFTISAPVFEFEFMRQSTKLFRSSTLPTESCEVCMEYFQELGRAQV